MSSIFLTDVVTVCWNKEIYINLFQVYPFWLDLVSMMIPWPVWNHFCINFSSCCCECFEFQIRDKNSPWQNYRRHNTRLTKFPRTKSLWQNIPHFMSPKNCEWKNSLETKSPALEILDAIIPHDKILSWVILSSEITDNDYILDILNQQKCLHAVLLFSMP